MDAPVFVIENNRAYQADVFDEREFAVRRKALKEGRERLVDDLRALQNQLLSAEELEEKKRLVLAVFEHAQQAGLTLDAPFEFRQRMLKLLVDKIILDVNGGWFKIEGETPVVAGKLSELPRPTRSRRWPDRQSRATTQGASRGSNDAICQFGH